MKFNKIILLFGITLPVCIGLRLLQLMFTVDFTTGFFKPEYKMYGNIILLCILIFAALTAFFSFFSHRTPENPPKPNIVLSLASFALAGSVFYETISYIATANSGILQGSLLRLFGILCAAFFVMYGVNRFIEIKIPSLLSAIPVIYFIVKTICDFTSISSLALISDNVMLIAVYCFVLLFMLNFAKLYNNVQGDYGSRKLMAYSLTAGVLCFAQSVGNFAVNIMNDYSYLHTSMATNISIFCTGVFVTAFCFTYFKKEN